MREQVMWISGKRGPTHSEPKGKGLARGTAWRPLWLELNE